jgi:hypothetical protein
MRMVGCVALVSIECDPCDGRLGPLSGHPLSRLIEYDDEHEPRQTETPMLQTQCARTEHRLEWTGVTQHATQTELESDT